MNSKIYNFTQFCESSDFSLYPKDDVKKKKKKKKEIRKVDPKFTDELASAEEYMNDPSYNSIYSSIYDM